MFFERHQHKDQELPVFFNCQEHTPYEPPYEMHWHETREWIYVCKGRVEITIGEEAAIFSDGDVVTIAPRLPHVFRAVDEKTVFCCLIPDNSIPASCGLDNPGFTCDTLVTSPEVCRLFLDVIREYRDERPFHKSTIRAKIALMYAALFRDHGHQTQAEQAENTGRAMRLTQTVLRYMEEHYAEEFSGEALAAYLGYSRSYLCHVIRRTTGKSLTENLHSIRCHKARKMLRQGDSVGEVAFAVGFQNAPYFCRTYKRIMGVPPSAHIKK